MDMAERVGPYVLDDIVGQGSSGIVWRAFDEISGDVLAVKMLDAETAADPMARARFVRECELVGAFAHPNLVRLRAAGSTSGGEQYLVMDLALGETLMARLGRAPPMTLREGIEVVRQAAVALGAMHDAGWVHRDVKPANVILGRDDKPRLLDYGLAAKVGGQDEVRLTRAGFFVGTPLYLAPEQLLGAPPDPTMDVYALGAMLYEVLVGEPPFVGSTETLLAAKATKTAPAYEGPAPVGALLAESLARRPEGRPADATVFADRLAELMAPEDVQTDLEELRVPTARPLHDIETVTGAAGANGRKPPPRSPPHESAPRPPIKASTGKEESLELSPAVVAWVRRVLDGRSLDSAHVAPPGPKGRPEAVAGVIFAAGTASALGEAIGRWVEAGFL